LTREVPDRRMTKTRSAIRHAAQKAHPGAVRKDVVSSKPATTS